MKKLFATGAIVFLLTIPIISYGQAEQNVPKAPAVSPGLVREGNFAIELVEVLKLGTANNETEAENMLASAGIAPKNGWIADYPLTPDIIGEVRRAIGVALDSGKITMKKDEALLAVQVLIDSQWRQLATSGKEQERGGGGYPSNTYAYEGYDPYYNPDPYYSPYYYPYPYYGGYYYPYPYLYPYPYFRGGFGIRGFRGGYRGGRR